MKYALLGYDLDHTLEHLTADRARALHRGHAQLREHELPTANRVKLIAHYRFRPASLATTLRIDGEGTVRREGPASDASATLRALYILESDDPDAVTHLAEHLPATTQGATIEIWPLTEPRQ
jgi:hypothetical protein